MSWEFTKLGQPPQYKPGSVAVSKTGLQELVVITICSNPVRYKTRYELYKRFETKMLEAGATMITVEMAFGARPFVVTDKENPHHVQVRSQDELWHKENLIEIGAAYAVQVYPKTKNIAWIDSDVLPIEMSVREWLEETVHQLQHYHVVQMFKTAIDMDPNFTMHGHPQQSFMSKYVESGYQLPRRGGFWGSDYYRAHGHPGFAWAATRTFWDQLGIYSGAILGAGDRHMALGLVGCIDQTFEHINQEYRNSLMQWQERAERWIKRDVGFVKGSIYHMWHGKKKDRGYTDRWKILRDNNYNPLTDIKKDAQGLYMLETWDARQIRLRDQLRSYFRSRNEDSVDL